MPRSRLPSVLKDGRNFSGRHGTTVEMNRKQHTASGSMRQGGEYGFVSINSRFRFKIAHRDIKPHS
ncbi:MAG TPA: hypothetical protein VKD70_08340 [Candidatus Acidoferrum sp.]|nr:hypothetical protein [Candidatus Acidoferrum sp.]